MTAGLDKKSTHGGKRAGAGRPKSPRNHDAPHRARPPLSPDHPVHVVLRVKQGMQLRQDYAYHAIRGVLAHYVDGSSFRIVHISIQQTHLHLIVEAADREALTHGMQSFAIRAARALLQGGCGKVFTYRYHATQIKTARFARNAIMYVLNNWRRHREDYNNGRQRTAALDPYSSAVSFAGWTQRFAKPPAYDPLLVSRPHTHLLQRWSKSASFDPLYPPGPLRLAAIC